MTLDKRITKFVQDHPGDWHRAYPDEDGRFGERRLLVAPSIYLCLVVSLGRVDAIVVAYAHEVDFYGAFLPGDDLLCRGAVRVADAMQRYGGSLSSLPPWLVEPVRVELGRRANDLLTLSGAPTTSPEISPDSQAIEQARNRLKAATDINGEQALGVLEDLRRILGVTV